MSKSSPALLKSSPSSSYRRGTTSPFMAQDDRIVTAMTPNTFSRHLGRKNMTGPLKSMLSHATRRQVRIKTEVPRIANDGTGVVLVADISGFTAYGERMIRRHRGAKKGAGRSPPLSCAASTRGTSTTRCPRASPYWPSPRTRDPRS